MIPESRGFDAPEILALASELGQVSFFAAPTMLKRLVESARGLGARGDGIKSVIYGGGPMYAADLEAALQQFGPRLTQIYGQGESPMTITVLPRDLVVESVSPRWAARRNTVGYAQACVSVRVVDEAFEDVATGETGEVVVSGDTVMMGYWDNPSATAEALRDGWLRTGDLGRLDADGYLTLTDRSKDVIISGGTNIYPREVEEVLARHPAMLEVSVIGAPDLEWGEQVVAFVVFRPDQTCATALLEAWCRAEIASFKKPKRWEFIDELPKNSYGKVLKTELRARLGGER